MSDPYHRLNTSYCGFMAQQWWCDFLLWEELLTLHPETSTIVEIGTGSGGFSLYLQHQCEVRGIRFRTFDHGLPEARLWLPGFRRADVFGERGRSLIAQEFVGPTILHCDGGDKRREVAEYAMLLKPNSYAVVHDYGTEFNDEDVPRGLAFAHRELTEAHGSLSRILVREAAR